MLANVRNPYEDELLYSWINRLAEANCLPLTSFSCKYLGDRSGRMGLLPLDVRKEFPELYESIQTDKGIKEMYLSLTTFLFESMFMITEEQAAYLNNVFYPQDGTNPPVNSLFKTVRVCPECMKEDTLKYGEAYLHRSHQLSPVHTCYKHKVPLMEYRGKAGHACEFNMSDYGEEKLTASLESLAAGTAYTQRLFEAGINTDIFRIKKIVEALLNERYGQPDANEEFYKDIADWNYRDLFDGIDLPKFFKTKWPSLRYVTAAEMMPILMFLCPDVERLIPMMEKHGEVIKEYHCGKCGKTYCASPLSHDLYARHCPECDTWPVEGAYRQSVYRLTNGEYEAFAEPKDTEVPVAIRHNKCGKVTRIRPKDFIQNNARCRCEKRITEEEARKAVEAHDGFRLVKFTSADEPITVYHETCGQEFVCDYHRFINFPVCMACGPLYTRADVYADRVRELIGDEYEVTTPFVDPNVKVTFKHNVCGQKFSCRPSAFLLDGQRCKACRTILTHKELEGMLDTYSNGRYRITSYAANTCIVEDMETGTKQTLSPLKVAQEIKRETPSKILPVAMPVKVDVKQSNAWERGFDYLQQYIAEHGDSNIPKRDTYKGYNLGLWCQKQREAYKTGRLKPQRKEKLESVGFALDPLEAEWNRRYEQYQRYAAENGAYIPRRRDFEGEHLGAWVESQRKMYNAGKLSDERKTKLLKVNPTLFDKRENND